ncbi:hypothetical protein PAPHI01_0990 [Pancytospora philotis]|nr:hypothetical protein PAPHI01_0990 [Pancytospora philotis]
MDYETTNGLFNSEGRMVQVEYAQNASTQGSTIIIQKEGRGLSIAYENRQANGLLIPMDKIFTLDAARGLYLIFSGLKPDSLRVTREANFLCRSYRYTNGADMPVAMLARVIGEYKQQYTVDQSYRPLGLRTVLFTAEHGDPRIFIIETDGNFSEHKSCCLGFKSDIVTARLEADRGEGSIFQAMLQVLQKDAAKVRAFELTADGFTEHSEDYIKAKFDN